MIHSTYIQNDKHYDKHKYFERRGSRYYIMDGHTDAENYQN